MPFALAAGVFSDVEVFQQHRETGFQNFRVGQARIGHVGVHGIGTVETGTGGRAGADGFVILIFVIAEGQIIHRALRCGHGLGRAEQAVGDSLTDLDIARHDRRRILRREH